MDVVGQSEFKKPIKNGQIDARVNEKMVVIFLSFFEFGSNCRSDFSQ
jgi:hypothetical protein